MPEVACVLDCDGTLLNTMPMWLTAFDTMAAAHGKTITPADQARLETQASASGHMRLLNQVMHLVDDDEAFVEEFYAYVEDFYRYKVDALPGAVAFVERLEAAGIPFVVASGTRGDIVAAGLEANGFSIAREQVLSCEDTGIGKYDPDIYQRACAHLGVDPAHLWAFEDEVFALTTARNFGCHTASVTASETTDPAEVAPLCERVWASWDEVDPAELTRI